MKPTEYFLLFGILAITLGCLSIVIAFIKREPSEKQLIILKTNPCQVETIMEARELIESGAECDEVEVIDVSNYKIPDDVNEFSIEDSGYNGKPGKIKHYKRNRDRIFKEVETPKQ